MDVLDEIGIVLKYSSCRKNINSFLDVGENHMLVDALYWV